MSTAAPSPNRPDTAGGFAAVVSRDEPSSPYPGLRPFDEAEAHLFFGREEQSDTLLERLHAHRFLALIGVSGCGKSSLVRAGVIPGLRANLLGEPGTPLWRIAILRPGDRPMSALAAALSALPEVCGPRGEQGQPDQAIPWVEATLRRGPFGVVELLQETPLSPSARLLILVDQFEEIFRYREGKVAPGLADSSAGDHPPGEPSGRMDDSQQVADAFVALVLESANQEAFPDIYVALTMRSDYLGQCPCFPGLAERISDSQFLVPRLSREQRRRAITGPARQFGAKLEPPLVNRLLNESGGDPDQLPVLQHLLLRMWGEATARDAKTGGSPTLTLDDYEAVGGMSQALSQHADSVLKALSEKDQARVAPRLFRSLVNPEPDKEDTRRLTTVEEVEGVACVEPDAVIRVADAFRQAGFLVSPDAVLTRQSVLDIVHESLIRRWGTLRSWVKVEAEAAEMYRRLRQAARLRQEKKQSLWRPPEVWAARRWEKKQRPTPRWAARYGDPADLPPALRFLRLSLLYSYANRIFLICLPIALAGLIIRTRVQQEALRAQQATLRVQQAQQETIRAQARIQIQQATLRAQHATLQVQESKIHGLRNARRIEELQQRRGLEAAKRAEAEVRQERLERVLKALQEQQQKTKEQQRKTKQQELLAESRRREAEARLAWFQAAYAALQAQKARTNSLSRTLSEQSQFIDSPPPYQPPPAAPGPYPYHLSLSQVLSQGEMDRIRQTGQLVFQATGSTGAPYRQEAQRSVAQAMEGDYRDPAARPSFLYLLGDVVMYYGEAANYYSQFYQPYARYPGPIFAIPGNHDGAVKAGGAPTLTAFLRNFCSPTPVVPPKTAASLRAAMIQPNVYWTLETPYVTIVGLYTNVPEGPGTLDASQKEWLVHELQTAPKDRFLILALHHTVYSYGLHAGSSSLRADLDNACLQANRVPDLVLSGHAHDYEHVTAPLNGIPTPFVNAGSGGYPILFRAPTRRGDQPGVTYNAYNNSDHGYLRIIATQSMLRVSFIGVPTGAAAKGTAKVFDSFPIGPK